jgi:hypothetical protein
MRSASLTQEEISSAAGFSADAILSDERLPRWVAYPAIAAVSSLLWLGIFLLFSWA